MQGYASVLFLYICLLTTCFPVGVHGANLLFVFDKPGTSHYHDASIIASILHGRGHEITFLIPSKYQNDSSVTKFDKKFQFDYSVKRQQESEEINVVQIAQDIQTGLGNFNWELLKMPGKLVMGVIDIYVNAVPDLMSDTDLNDRLMSANFDLICFEGSFLWLHPFIQRLNIPYVTLTTSSAASMTNTWFHAPNIPAILPAFMIKVHHRKPMSFLWRALSTSMILGSKFYFSFPVDISLQKAAANFDRNPNVTATQSFGLAEMWMTNTDYTTDAPRPFLPNTALVGGLSAVPAGKLDNEWQEIMNRSSEHGVLLVSMGTVVKGVRPEQVEAMAAAFARLPQTVVWKEVIPRPQSLGKNTIMKPWIPQNDLLGHPNTRAMVYHCGNNGAFEALYHGVPIVGVPVFADQTDVAYRIMSNNMGLVVELPTLTADTMFQAVSDVINNPKYMKRAQVLSKIYRDNPDSAPERAAFWMEYVLRHKGAKFLRSKVAYQGILAEYLIDVVFFLFVIGFVFVKVLRIILSSLWYIFTVKLFRKYHAGCGSFYDPTEFEESD